MNNSVHPTATTSRFVYPFKSKEEKEFTDPLAFYKGLSMVSGGHYLLGTHGFWHGGIHFSNASANAFSQEGGVRCIADGEVVAYRIDQTYPDGKPGAVPGTRAILPYSTGFVLVRHYLQPPKLPAPTPVKGAAPPRPLPSPPKPLTLYSLYMHLADHASYEADTARATPGWWQGPNRRVVKLANKDMDPSGKRFGLNIRKGPTARTEKVGWLARGAVVVVSQTSEDGKWGKLSTVIKGEAEWFGTADLAAPKGWVHMGSLETRRTPDAYGSVVVLKQPHPLRAGEVVGYMGEDVPANTRFRGDRPMTRPLLHLEVFSGEDVPDFIKRCRAYAPQLPKSHWTLLHLRKGDILHGDPATPEGAGTNLGTVPTQHIIPLAATKLWTATDGKRWREVTAKIGKSDLTGWVEEEGHLCTPWHWEGFITIEGDSTESGTRWAATVEEIHAYLMGGPKPKESDFYQNLRKAIDRDGDGELSERELDAALSDRLLGPLLGRTIALHESEWAGKPELKYWPLEKLAERLGSEALEKFNREKPRIVRLQWWKYLKIPLEHPQENKSYHFHPIGLSANFGSPGCACNRDITAEQISVVISNDQIKNGLFHRSSYVGVQGATVNKFMDILNLSMSRYGINECIDKAIFIAHLVVECDRFKTTEEYKGRGGSIPAHWHNYRGGANYHGRGLIQLTHDDNYSKYFRAAGFPADTPVAEVASNLEMATDSACWYWRNGSAWGDLSEYARSNDFIYTAIGVNGGFNHARERESYVVKLKESLCVGACSTHNYKTNEKYDISESAIKNKKVGLRIWRKYFGDSYEIY